MLYEVITSGVADRTDDGSYNYNLMKDSPAKNWIETNLNSNGVTGWYLPSIDELGLLWHSRFHVNKVLRSKGYSLLVPSKYWSSTEVDGGRAFYYNQGVASDDSEGGFLPIKRSAFVITSYSIHYTKLYDV